MTTCSECGRDISDGAWVCGMCGAPVTDRGPAPDTTNYYENPGTEYGSDQYTSSQYVQGAPVLAAAPRPARQSPQIVWMIGLGGLIVVLAIVLVWFFVLRGPAASGTGFAGTWTGTGSDKTEVVIEATNGGYQLSMNNDKGEKVGPFTTQMADGSLTTSLDVTADSSDKQKAAGALFKQIMGSVYPNFVMVLKYRSTDDVLLVSLQGIAAAAGKEEVLHRH
jgi:hypothetical protein